MRALLATLQAQVANLQLQITTLASKVTSGEQAEAWPVAPLVTDSQVQVGTATKQEDLEGTQNDPDHFVGTAGE